MNNDDIKVVVGGLCKRVNEFEKQVDERIQKIEERLNMAHSEVFLMKDTLSVKEAALYIGFKPSTIYNMVRSGRIPAHRPCRGLIYFEREELEEWKRNNLVPLIPREEAILKARIHNQKKQDEKRHRNRERKDPPEPP